MAFVVVLGTAGIVYSRDERQPDTTRPLPPIAGRAGDHWHAAIGFYICGQFAPNLPEGSDPLGIHGHGDNIVHIHPFGTSASGKRARLGVWFDTENVDINATSIKLPDQDRKRNGDDCDNGKGKLQMKVWDSQDPSDPGRIIDGDPRNFRPQDGQLITIAFVPEGTDIPRPPSAATLNNLSDVGPQASTTTTTALGADSSASTTSTTPGSSTTSTTGASSTTSTSRP
jgi:hypothetical protein